MCSPAPISVATARCSAAWPDAVAMAPTPASSAAILSSSTATVGLEMREYTCPARSMLKSDAACSLSRNTYEVVWYTGTARLPVAGSGDCPACRAKVSKPGYFGPATEKSVQVLPRGARVRLEGTLGLLLLRGALLPVAVEHLVHQRGDLGDLALLELAAEDGGDVLDHAAALRLVDRLRRRPDEHEARFLLAVLEVHGDVD